MIVIRKSVIAHSLKRLREQKTHALFAGYLCLQRRTAELDRLDDLQPNFLAFFNQFFLVVDHPLGTPFIKPFTEQKPSTRNLWLNENVAGSYAPSSLRPDQPFRQVVDISNRKYSLSADHARRALKHLAYGNPIQVADLATLLYRDFGFTKELVTIKDLIDTFSYEFGYSIEVGKDPNDDFHRLYSAETARDWETDWLEEYEPAE